MIVFSCLVLDRQEKVLHCDNNFPMTSTSTCLTLMSGTGWIGVLVYYMRC